MLKREAIYPAALPGRGGLDARTDLQSMLCAQQPGSGYPSLHKCTHLYLNYEFRSKLFTQSIS